MIKLGIDKACFYTSAYYLELSDLAKARGVEKDKYLIGLGQKEMAVIPPDEGIVTMAASAASKLLENEDKSKIRTLLFATESGIDYSKSAGIYVHRLLDLPTHTRTIELKQACYAGTGALQLALGYLYQNPDEKVLLITSDIARYGLNTPGESSQGGGAVAMLLSVNPRLISIEPGSGLFTEDIMDFWRPNYKEEALVEGKTSCDQYLKALKESWQDYFHRTQREFHTHQHFLYHIPFPRLAEKAHQKLSMTCNLKKPSAEETSALLSTGLTYAKKIGNCYTGSLYLGLISLLENHPEDLKNQRIGFYSYGSGCVAEFFSGLIQPGYEQVLFKKYHQDLLNSRQLLSIAQYENFYSYQLPKDGTLHTLPEHTHSNYRLSKLENHKQIYIKKIVRKNIPETLSEKSVSARAPGKLILSGEHSVVSGGPAIAIAINRYAVTTIKQSNYEFNSESKSESKSGSNLNSSVLFDLLNVQHKSLVSRETLRSLKSRIKSGYQSFLKGEKSIREVLEKPFELLQYTATNMLEKLNPQIELGLEIHTESDIPIGCGMGSSAASIVSTNYALFEFFSHKDNKNLSGPDYFEWSLDAENIQHGKSSGIDVQMALQGGVLYYQQGRMEKIPTFPWPLFIINTGPSSSSTGECVTQTQKIFKERPDLLDQMSRVTEEIKTSIEIQDNLNFCKAIAQNHQFLCQLGVVPLKIQTLIQTIENFGGAAKICGAGSISGDTAGIVLIVGLSLEKIRNIGLPYPIEEIFMAPHGVEKI